MADNITVGSLLLASPPQAQSNPFASARRASSGIASIGSWAPELNSTSIFIVLRTELNVAGWQIRLENLNLLGPFDITNEAILIFHFIHGIRGDLSSLGR